MPSSTSLILSTQQNPSLSQPTLLPCIINGLFLHYIFLHQDQRCYSQNPRSWGGGGRWADACEWRDEWNHRRLLRRCLSCLGLGVVTTAPMIGFNVSMKNEHGYFPPTCWCFDSTRAPTLSTSTSTHALRLLISIVPKVFSWYECAYIPFMHHRCCFSFRLRLPWVSLVYYFLVFCRSFRRCCNRYYYLPHNCSVYGKRIGMQDLSS